jgi:uncharacterized protein
MNKTSKTVLLLALFIISISSQTSCPSVKTVSVSGTGTVTLVPNMATLSISLNEFNTSSSLAISQLNTLTTNLTAILKANGVATADITTTYISIYPQTSYYANGTSYISGASASQTITAVVRNLGTNNVNLGKLFDSLSVVAGISLYNNGFDNSNKAAALSSAYTLAYADAKSKGTLLANLAGTTVSGVMTITDNTYLYGPVVTATLGVVYLLK